MCARLDPLRQSPAQLRKCRLACFRVPAMRRQWPNAILFLLSSESLPGDGSASVAVHLDDEMAR